MPTNRNGGSAERHPQMWPDDAAARAWARAISAEMHSGFGALRSQMTMCIRERVDVQPKDWATFCRQGAEFHLKNARAWANRAVGEDLSAQVDPDFVLGGRMPAGV